MRSWSTTIDRARRLKRTEVLLPPGSIPVREVSMTGDQLRKARPRAGATQEQLASRLGVLTYLGGQTGASPAPGGLTSLRWPGLRIPLADLRQVSGPRARRRRVVREVRNHPGLPKTLLRSRLGWGEWVTKTLDELTASGELFVADSEDALGRKRRGYFLEGNSTPAWTWSSTPLPSAVYVLTLASPQTKSGR